ncbi:MAG: polymer-forming cytoskeletal protein [Hyphomicrobiales bacterium]
MKTLKTTNFRLKPLYKFTFFIAFFAISFLSSQQSFAQFIIPKNSHVPYWNGDFPIIAVGGGKQQGYHILRGNNGVSTSFVFKTGSKDVLTIDYDKGLGIGGLNTSGSPIGIMDETRFTRGMILNNSIGMTFANNDVDNSYFNFRFVNSNGKAAWSVGDPDHPTALSVRNNGKVGIGTSQPETDFQVKGESQFEGNVKLKESLSVGTDATITGLLTSDKLSAKEAKIDGTVFADRVSLKIGSFPDYVFSKNYKLMPLADVESFINKNSHLPGVKSESQMVNEGMDLAKMNKILMEKVEELTLYTIQQEHRIQNLEQKINNSH